MTTPERLRRRQRIETFLVIATMVLTVGSYLYFNHQRDKVLDCFADQFHDLSVSLTTRSDLTSDELDTIGHVIDRISKSKTGPEVRSALDTYNRERKEINSRRDGTPIPPYPTGKCD